MIHSMTGYGRSTAEFGGKKIHAEVKSLNSKSMDLSTRIAHVYREKEMELRTLLSTRLERGKVDFTLWVEKDETLTATPINTALVGEYYNQIRNVSRELGLDTSGLQSAHEWMKVLLRLPGVMVRSEVEELGDEEWNVVLNTVNKAVDQLVDFRRQEGEALAKKFDEKITNISSLLDSIEPYEKERVERIRQRITAGLSSIPEVEYDRNRLEQEMIYYIEKLDISEEKQRLRNHLKYFVDTMRDGHGQGKKLGFIAQEMGREINTTGSKSNQAEMQNIVVKMKDELEQIKEQVLNVL
ncbi:MAG: YicC family protein [Bacteroidaceae bacterium]|nr:YicC family protein [Bacteroidaceae bacterium]